MIILSGNINDVITDAWFQFIFSPLYCYFENIPPVKNYDQKFITHLNNMIKRLNNFGK